MKTKRSLQSWLGCEQSKEECLGDQTREFSLEELQEEQVLPYLISQRHEHLLHILQTANCSFRQTSSPVLA